MALVNKDGGGGTPLPEHTASEVRFEVTPENVVALAALMRRAADRLLQELPGLDADMRMTEPWMDDPVSHWAMDQLNNHTANGLNSLFEVYAATHREHNEAAKALKKIADDYGKTDELNAELMKNPGQTQ